MKVRKKPVVIDAVRWDGNIDTASRFLGDRYDINWRYASATSDALIIPTLEGDMRAEPGDWIAKGVEGEFYPIKDSVFQKTYEPVDDESLDRL